MASLGTEGGATTARMLLGRAEFSQQPLLLFHVALASRGLPFISFCLAIREPKTKHARVSRLGSGLVYFQE